VVEGWLIGEVEFFEVSLGIITTDRTDTFALVLYVVEPYCVKCSVTFA